MIEINLSPEEARSKKTKFDIQANYLLYIIPPVIFILVLTHAYLLVMFLAKSHRARALDKKWASLEPERKTLAALSSEYNVLSQNSLAIQGVTSRRVLWAEKLNKLSLNLPPGVWFNEISISNINFKLNGSVVSLQKGEINLINKFLDSLKNDANFSGAISDLELGPMQRRALGTYEVVDFVLIGDLKRK